MRTSDLNVSLDGVGTVIFSRRGRDKKSDIFYTTSFKHNNKTVSMQAIVNFKNRSVGVYINEQEEMGSKSIPSLNNDVIISDARIIELIQDAWDSTKNTVGSV